MENETRLQVCGDFYTKCSVKQGLFIPLIDECTWAREARAALYLFALLYCFLGVAIIADIFMGSIEKITSKTRKIYLATPNEDQPEVYEVRLWSDTVANLTLMALGSSAPEILLSIYEVISNNFEAGQLGPGTIVGSAAFNLFVIIAICISSIPNGETRRMRYLGVFGVTASFSVLAYVWLLLILTTISPNEVELWEASVTLGLFPVLVLVAWLVEKKCTSSKAVDDKQIELGNFQPGETDKLMKNREFFRNGRLDRDGLVEFIKEVKKYPGLTDEDAATLAATKLVESQSHSRMWYRVGAIRSMTGGRKTIPTVSTKLKQVYNAMNEHPDAPTLGDVPKIKQYENAIMNFHSASSAVMENIGKFPIQICRSGKLDNQVKVRVESIDGSAVVVEDYIKINEIVTFESGETEKEIMVEIVNDNQWEPDEEFFIKISLLYNDTERSNVQLGRVSIMEITILNDDEPGTLMFQKRGIIVKESVGDAVITVVRKNGADGDISVKWKTINKSAIEGKDFHGKEGTLVFKHTETERDILIPIVNDLIAEKDEHFEVELYEVEGGAKIGQINRTAITIINDDNFDGVVSHLMHLTNANLDAIQVHHETYLGQIKDALNVNGGDLENASCADYVLHFLTFGWKVIFSLVPPPSIAGGWLCFVISLMAIGLLTAIIGEIAALFGCLVGIEDSVTAITLVALGTSLPDTFASKSAAIQEKYADNAVGNVTGSNSVNVFLGLGLPWFIAGVYHKVKDGSTFRVPGEGLGFSVGIFTGLCVVCISILIIRRFTACSGKAELGGPTLTKYLSSFILVCLWFIYLTFSILRTYGVL